MSEQDMTDWIERHHPGYKFREWSREQWSRELTDDDRVEFSRQQRRTPDGFELVPQPLWSRDPILNRLNEEVKHCFYFSGLSEDEKRDWSSIQLVWQDWDNLHTWWHQIQHIDELITLDDGTAVVADIWWTGRISYELMAALVPTSIRTSTEHVVTDLTLGTLSDADREQWLKAYAGPDDQWTDAAILMAMGSGFA